MAHITFRNIEIHEVDRISEIDASIYIKYAWRDIDGKKQLIELNYDEQGYPNGLDEHIKALIDTITNNGYALGAFDENHRMIGFITLNKPLFGKSYQYVLLDQLFISKNYRKQGIGKKLINLSMQEAKSWGADKLYICAGSSQDTIAFYERLGCIEAKEINQEFYESDPRDIQLELKL